MPSNQFFLARQPIVDRNRELVAYELLFRSSLKNCAEVNDGRAASAAVIQHAFLDLGMEDALGGKTAFINMSEDLLMSDVVEALPAGHVVLELLETIQITPTLIQRCRALKAKGLRFALDDVVELSGPISVILPLIDVVKVDVLAASPEALRPIAEAAARHGAKLLAEKVDSQEQFERFHAAGYSLFQGYHFARPKILQGRTLSPSAMSLFKLLELITSDAEVGEIEEVVKGSPDLVFRLLKLVNSAALGRSQKVSNLRSAIIVLGREQLGRLVQIMFFKLGNERPVSADPLAQAAVVRGRMMEGLVGAVGVSPALKPSAFMLGMLSLADALFGETPEQLAAFLALDEVMCAALLRREGPLGRMLAVVEMAEQVQTVAQAELLAALLAETGIGDIATLTQLQLEALRFTNDL